MTAPQHVEATAGWDGFATVEIPSVALSQGPHDLRLTVVDGWIDVNWLSLRREIAPPPPAEHVHAVPGLIQAEDFGGGGEGVAYHDADAGNQGGSYRDGDVDIRPCADIDGGFQVGWWGAGEWLSYPIDAAEGGIYELCLRVASGTGAGMHVSVDGQDVTACMRFRSTGTFDNWIKLEIPGIVLTQGRHVLRLTVDEGWLDLNWLALRVTDSISGLGWVMPTPTASPRG